MRSTTPNTTTTSTDARPPATEEDLEARLSEPTEDTIDAAARLGGDLLILGAAGKMGPSLAVLAARSIVAADAPFEVICVSRFTTPGVAAKLRAAGIRVVVADLLDEGALEELPDAPNVIFLAGRKFGASSQPELTWALNCYLPARVAERFRASRIVALSTGNVYPYVSAASGGAAEDTPVDPVGEYAHSCVGRERILTYVSTRHGTPGVIVRLNYATDLRYGVLVDVAQSVFDRATIDLSVPSVNTIWQRDANSVLLRAFDLASVPFEILNVTGPDVIFVRHAAEKFASRFGLPPPSFSGPESDVALLSNASRCQTLFGAPRVSTETLIEWVADWVGAGRPTLGKPTHFSARDGRF